MIKRRLWMLFAGLATVLALSACASIAIGEGLPTISTVVPAPSSTVVETLVQSPIPDETEGEVDVPAEHLAPVGQLEGQPSVGTTTPEENIYPVLVSIPQIEVEAEIIDLGLNPDGTLEVPKDFGLTGWYTGRSVPGNVGPSVVVGHVDSTTGPAVFYRLRDLSPGDIIEIYRSDGTLALFRVTGTEMVLKDEFPTDQVYGPTAEPTLRLITCGGTYDKSAFSYRSNFIVYAEHVSNSAPNTYPPAN